METVVGRTEAGGGDRSAGRDPHSSGVSWAAVTAGAFVAAALSLALLALGTGIGFSGVSPWASDGESASRIGWTAIWWLVLTQVVASGAGGYLTGRLRTRWVSIHTHEVFFRDTAHGFLVWAVGLVVTAAFLTSAATSLLGSATRGSGPAGYREGLGRDVYYVDMLLRTPSPAPDREKAFLRGEVGLILGNALREGSLPPGDKVYLGQLVAARTGVGQAEAEKRVGDLYAQAREAAESVRRAVAHSMYWTFLALLVGAFCASLAATMGGRERDRVVVI